MSHSTPKGRPFKSAKDLEAWLEGNHAKETELWVKLAKKGSGIASVTYAEAVDVALCYGWIDGLSRSLDESFYLQRFTPRKAKGNWTETNCRKAEAFIAQGRMKPSGLRAIENAKAAGQWKPATSGHSKKSR
jgi:uncharacterized protein YdeI (YjbR/CyaY-like superfamily)